MNLRKSGIVALAVLFALFFLSARLLSAQAIDPFYLKLFQDGEASFRARNFAEAAKDLEVAVFGLAADQMKAATVAGATEVFTNSKMTSRMQQILGKYVEN